MASAIARTNKPGGTFKSSQSTSAKASGVIRRSFLFQTKQSRSLWPFGGSRSVTKITFTILTESSIEPDLQVPYQF